MEKKEKQLDNHMRTVFSVTVTGSFPSPKNGAKSFSARNIAPTKVMEDYSSKKRSFNSNDKEFLNTVKEIMVYLEKSNAHIEEMQYTPPILYLTVSFTSKKDAELFRKLIYGRS